MLRFGLLLLVGTTLACSSQAPLVGQGGACELATDCQGGLICAPQKNDAGSICTSDLGGVQQLPPAPPAPPTPPVVDAAAVSDATSDGASTTLPEAAAGD